VELAAGVAVAAAGVVEAPGGGAILATVEPAAAAAAAIEANTALKLGAVLAGALETGVAGEVTGVVVFKGACGL